MDRARVAASLLLCGVLAACGDAPPEPDENAALTGGHQQTPTGTGGAATPTGSGGVESGTGGSSASGGAVGTGGSSASGGIVGTGGTVASGGIVGQGGRVGTGGAGNTGSTVPQGGTTGSRSDVDLTCNNDDDCCVRVDTCRAIAVLYSKIQGLVYWPPSTSTSCLRCLTPVVEVSCKNNQCTGTVVDPMGNSSSHCGKIQRAGSGGTTGTTTRTGAADGAAPLTPALGTSQQLVFGCG